MRPNLTSDAIAGLGSQASTKPERTLLIVDDDPDVLTAVRLLLKTEVKQVVTEKSPENLKYLLSQQPFDLILLDMNFNSSINTGNEGFFCLKKIKE